ncbi:uncharacterized protein LOC114526992 [Dendronephthya gigantea]|uniref:uncharacterized protein LOC114526992 n=1 Tax=Dendronephthya gigantea TaxID=151771 RepID=UPI00106AB157|nr:uncharacterized protein LOC114526992 [Dendronephthya gigantea]XP_028404348.1 uncharacterized protein LOC114526992 [Dendronephthya gigantea]
MGGSESKEETSKTNKFVLVGSSGCGKSAFVNAVRSIDNEDWQAAGVDIVEEKRELKEYIHPNNPLISFCDLPGYGTQHYPTVEMYWNNFNLEQFDKFLIFISLRVTNLDLHMIQKVKSAKKSLFIIRTKIDIEYMVEKDKSQFNENALIEKIRKYILNETNLTRKEIFLISNYRPSNWDFLKLIQAMEGVLPRPERGIWSHFFVKTMAKFSDAFQGNAIEAAEKLIKDLDEWKDVKISVAVIGKNGCGKSSFINAIRKVDDTDKTHAAKTGIVETTTIPMKYFYPNNPNITLWDCPGIGSIALSKLDDYSESIKIMEYDAFIIMTSERFGKITKALAEKLKSINKPFFFTRTKIDNDVKDNAERRNIAETITLQTIKTDCSKSLKLANAPLNDNDIFLISNHNPDKWDFARLTTAINDQLPSRVRESFLFTVAVFSEGILRRKVEKLKDRIWKVAATQALRSLVPKILLSEDEYSIIIEEVKFYRSELGLPESPEGQEAIKKFYLQPNTDVKRWLEGFDAHCGVNLGETNFTFLSRSMKNVLVEMETGALKLLNKTVEEATNQA